MCCASSTITKSNRGAGFRVRSPFRCGLLLPLIAVPYTLFQDFVNHLATHPVLIGPRTYVARPDPGIAILLIIVYYLLLSPLLKASMVRAVAGIYLGVHSTASQSIRFGASKLGWVLLAGFLSGLLIGVATLALIVPGIILYVRYSFIAPAIVVEGEKGGAIGRSWRLSKGLGWHIFGTLVLAGILAAIVTIILTLPASFITLNESLTTGTTSSSAWVLRAVLSSIATVIVTPFATTVGVLLYFDARIRKEGFDIAVMAREVGSATP